MIDRVTADIILKRCNDKKDGVYSYKGIPYMKCNGDIFIGWIGTIYQYAYGFLSPVNTCEYYKLKSTMKAKFKVLKGENNDDK